MAQVFVAAKVKGAARRRCGTVTKMWVIGLPALLAGCGKTPPQTIAKPAERQVAPRPAEVKVSIDNFSFSPAELSVPPGATVVWVNHDDVPHTVTATATANASAKAFASKALDTDDTFTHRFEQPGTYEYFCAVHPHMVGRVIVK